MGKSKAAKVQVPDCRYGAACTRRDCIFKHPPKQAKQQAAAAPKEKTDKVCFAFVAGRCAFGRLCHDRHPDEASCRSIRDRYSRIECQWGRNCRTEGCLYQHPSDEPAGPAMPVPVPRPQPAVFAAGPKIVPQQAVPEEARQRDGSHQAQMQIPKAIAQAADLRDPSTFDIPDPLERFLAVNAHNSGTQSAALLDLHFQSVQTFQPVLDDVLPERLRMFPDDGVWVVTGGGSAASSRGQTQGRGFYDAVHAYLLRNHYDFAIGQGGEGAQGAFFVRGRKKLMDPLEGVKAVFFCGLPGSGKSMVADALYKKAGRRFIRVSQDELHSDPTACEESFRRALAEASRGAREAREKPKGSWWWDQAFNPDRYYLAVCFRTSALSCLREACGLTLPRADHLHATLAYQPTTLDLRRHLGRPYRMTLRCHLVLEGTAAPHTGELFEVLLCTAFPVDSDTRARPVPLHITLAGPRTAARHLQVLNAVPTDKRIMANSLLGNFKVRHAGDLNVGRDVLGMSLLMYKTGDHRDTPASVSFDVASLVRASGAGPAGGAPAGVAAGGAGAKPVKQEWTPVGDAALASLDPVVVLEEVAGLSEHDWRQALGRRCTQLGFPPPQVRVSRPTGPTESKLAQWTRLRPSCLLHCAANEVALTHMVREGTAVLRANGPVALPPHPDSDDARSLPPVVLLDRQSLQSAERQRWMQLGGLQRSEVIALHMDVPEVECAARLARRGEQRGSPKAVATAEAAAAVRHLASLFEPPAEHEGFKAVVRLKGSTAAAQELVRRWTEEWPTERIDMEPQHLTGQAEEDNEAPAPPLPRLKEWIEAQPFPQHDPEQDRGRLEATTAWPPQPPQATAQSPEAHNEAQQEEDAEERARQEQLAATLRCMGFDDEPSLHAALRGAGGNLNVAVESVLQSRGAAV
mmetsp:Transcript_56857/g.178590  ORF Transcript_56857/g.178590 Transcript_56857/m.178590 type:complete len:916 (-) Transcript_56857:11-2758(-)